jgi:hypothetical protein
LPLVFESAGCELCRKAWAFPSRTSREDMLEQASRVNYARQAVLYRCKKCRGFWEDPNGNYPMGLTESEAKEFYGV